MKKHKFSGPLFGLLVLSSIVAFVYLNSVTPLHEHQEYNQGVRSPRIEEVDKPVLPDVEIIKKVVETGKRFIPAF